MFEKLFFAISLVVLFVIVVTSQKISVNTSVFILLSVSLAFMLSFDNDETKK